MSKDPPWRNFSAIQLLARKLVYISQNLPCRNITISVYSSWIWPMSASLVSAVVFAFLVLGVFSFFSPRNFLETFLTMTAQTLTTVFGILLGLTEPGPGESWIQESAGDPQQVFVELHWCHISGTPLVFPRFACLFTLSPLPPLADPSVCIPQHFF